MKATLASLILLVCISCQPGRLHRSPRAAERQAVREAKKHIADPACYHVLMVTNEGKMVLKLFNETPLHRDNFVEKIKAGFYDSLLFHRVINNFVIQGGDPASRNATPDTQLGNGEAPGPKIAAEFRTAQGIYHKRGALGMARDNNPEKASSNSQFYIVQRKPYRPAQLDSFAVQRNLTLNEAQQKIYTTLGGSPHLDGGYTVFGELVYGWDALDRLAAQKTDKTDRPVTPIRMRLLLLNRPRLPENSGVNK